MYTFEDKIEEIQKVINSKKGDWRLDVIPSISFDDISQIILIHIHEKFDSWDQSRPIENWVSTVAKNQIINQLRNNYYRTVSPCRGCKMNLDGNECSFTPSGKQCDECPLFKRWSKAKKNAYELKTAVSLDEMYSGGAGTEFDMARSVEEFHKVMFTLLDEKSSLLYKLLYIDCLEESEAAEQMGFQSNESRRPGYKQIFNLKKIIAETAQYIINHYDVIK